MRKPRDFPESEVNRQMIQASEFNFKKGLLYSMLVILWISSSLSTSGCRELRKVAPVREISRALARLALHLAYQEINGAGRASATPVAAAAPAAAEQQ